jgi:hypothetical protein
MTNNKIKKHELKKKQINLEEYPKHELSSQIHNPLNPRYGVNQEA